MHETRAHAANKIAAGQGHHRHAHPERLQRRGAAVVGQRVQGDVHIAILLHHRVQPGRAAHQQALAANAVRGKQIGKTRLHCRVAQRGCFEQQERTRQRQQHACPQRDGRRRELHGVVERGKHQRRIGRARRGQRVVVGRRPAKHAAGQLRNAFAEEFRVRRRADRGITNQPVHRAQAGGMRVAQKARLHRRRTQRKHTQPMRRSVPSQVNQDVHLITKNSPLQLAVVQTRRFEPALGADLRLARVLVVHGAGVIDADFQLRRVEVLQHRQHENIHRVLAVKVTRHEPDAQAPPGRFVVGKICSLRYRSFNRRAQLAMALGHFSRRERVLVEQGHGDAGGHARERVAPGVVGRLQNIEVAPGVAHAPAQAGIEQTGLGMVRILRKHLAQAVTAIGQLIHLGLDLCQRQQDRHVAGPVHKRLLQHVNRFLPVVVGINATRQRLQKIRIRRQRGTRKSLLGGGDIANAQQRLAQVHHGAKTHGPDVEQARQGRHRARCITGVQAPYAQPVQRLARHRLQRLRLPHGVGGSVSLHRAAHLAQPRQVKPAQPVARAVCRLRRKALGQRRRLRQARTPEQGIAARAVLPAPDLQRLQLRCQTGIQAQRLACCVAGLPGQREAGVGACQIQPQHRLPRVLAQVQPPLTDFVAISQFLIRTHRCAPFGSAE